MNDLFALYTAGAGALLVVTLFSWMVRGSLVAKARDFDAREQQADVWEQRLPDAVRYEDLAFRLGDLEDQRQELQDEVIEAKRLVNERGALEEQLASGRAELMSITPEREEQERLRMALDVLRGEQKELSENVQRALEDALNYERERDRLKEESGELLARLKREQLVLDQLGKDVEELSNRKSKLDAELTGLTEQQHQASGMVHELRKERDRLQEQLVRLQAEAAEWKAEARDAETRRDAAELAAVKAEERAETANRRVAELRLEGGLGGAEASTELWKPSVPIRQSRDAGPNTTDESERLDLVQQHLKSQNLIFPDRTVRALHTSFKIAEQSPLTVLAGISGTGKSELPRRYAEGMGMYFLPVAVQPRWDSPQDLLGFYNYLEKRFRPTELTRALLQFDGVRDDNRGWDASEDDYADLSEYMLVTLLDEMNLARVEYYFSDLLSRLETRRGLDRTDANARRNAELTLEVGLPGGEISDAEAILRVMVDTNVLFVGTMNEDESTQTLSDKVIDRAT